MNNNKGFIGIGIIIAIIAILVVGFAYMKSGITTTNITTTKTTTTSSDLVNNICKLNTDCKYISYTGGCNTPEYVAQKEMEAHKKGEEIGDAQPLTGNVTCTCESNKCVTHN